jgi:hypothetical protein
MRVLSHTGTAKESTAHVWSGIVSLDEGLGQQLKQHAPERGLDGVQAPVEVRFADHLWHGAVFVEEPAGFVDVTAEEGRGNQGDGHNFGGG